MAIFNDPVQHQDPNWTNISRPVPEAQADVSGGLALKGAGDAFGDVVKLTDQEIKRDISDESYKQVDVERDKFTQGLLATKNALDNGMVANAVNTASGASTGDPRGSVFDAHNEATDLPAGLDSGLDRMTQLTLAKRSGSLKLNDTDYSGKVLAIAKQLRNQFPGYRDYIDSEVSKASGLPVANSYYQNLMLDVNRQLQAASAKKDDMGNIMKSNLKVPNMGAYIIMRQTDPDKYSKMGGDAAVLMKISDYANMESTLDIEAKKRAASKDDLETQKNTERGNLTRNVTNLIDHFNTDNIQLSGMPALKELTGFMEDFAAHGGDTKGLAERTAQLQAYYQMIRTRALKMSNGPDTIIGVEEAQKIVDKGLAPLKGWIDLANSKSPDLAHLSALQVEAIKNDDERDWLFNKDRGAVARQLITARSIYGEQYFPQWLAGILRNNLDANVGDVFSKEALQAVKPLEDARGQPIQRTIVDAVRDGKKKGIPDPEFNGKMVDLVTGITDPAMPQPMKDQLLKWGFSKPELMDELRKDYKDPNTGNWVPGKQAAFNRMTSPAMSAAIAENAKSNPANYQMYKNWTESEFGKIFRGNLQDLNKLLEDQGDKKAMHFGWNNSAKQFVLLDGRNNPITRQETGAMTPPTQFGLSKNTGYVNRMLDTLESTNRGLANMAKVYEVNPGKNEMPLDTYLLRVVQTAGFRPGSNLTNASENMARALIKTNAPEKSLADIDKILFGKK